MWQDINLPPTPFWEKDEEKPKESDGKSSYHPFSSFDITLCSFWLQAHTSRIMKGLKCDEGHKSWEVCDDVRLQWQGTDLCEAFHGLLVLTGTN